RQVACGLIWPCVPAGRSPCPGPWQPRAVPGSWRRRLQPGSLELVLEHLQEPEQFAPRAYAYRRPFPSWGVLHLAKLGAQNSLTLCPGKELTPYLLPQAAGAGAAFALVSRRPTVSESCAPFETQ